MPVISSSASRGVCCLQLGVPVVPYTHTPFSPRLVSHSTYLTKTIWNPLSPRILDISCTTVNSCTWQALYTASQHRHDQSYITISTLLLHTNLSPNCTSRTHCYIWSHSDDVTIPTPKAHHHRPILELHLSHPHCLWPHSYVKIPTFMLRTSFSQICTWPHPEYCYLWPRVMPQPLDTNYTPTPHLLSHTGSVQTSTGCSLTPMQCMFPW